MWPVVLCLHRCIGLTKGFQTEHHKEVVFVKRKTVQNAIPVSENIKIKCFLFSVFMI